MTSNWQLHAQAAIVDLTAALTTTDPTDPAAAHAHLRDAAESIGRALGALEDALENEDEPA